MTEYYIERFYNEYALKKGDIIIAVIDTGTNARKVCKLLNEKEERIKELQHIIDTIAKDYEESQGMDIRNAEWFTAW